MLTRETRNDRHWHENGHAVVTWQWPFGGNGDMTDLRVHAPDLFVVPHAFWKVGFDPSGQARGHASGHALDEPNGPSQHLEEFQFHCGGLAFAGATFTAGQ